MNYEEKYDQLYYPFGNRAVQNIEFSGLLKAYKGDYTSLVQPFSKKKKK